jgi:hypothetical protein
LGVAQPLELALLESLDAGRYPLADGDWYLALRHPTDLLKPELELWRDAIVALSSAAFGADRSESWERRFSGDFLQKLFRWFMVFDSNDGFVATAGYRAQTIGDERFIWWDTSSVHPAHSGHGIVVQLERAALALESKLSGLPVWLIGRTRNPVGLRGHIKAYGAAMYPNGREDVPDELRRVFITAAHWLGFEGLDPVTGKIPDTYADREPMYAQGGEPVSADADVNAFMASLGPSDGVMMVVGPDAHLPN